MKEEIEQPRGNFRRTIGVVRLPTLEHFEEVGIFAATSIGCRKVGHINGDEVYLDGDRLKVLGLSRQEVLGDLEFLAESLEGERHWIVRKVLLE